MNQHFLNYDQIATEYNQRYPSQQPTQRGLALLALAKQVKAEKILEVGSGTGFWLNLLHQVTVGLYGFDYSAGMIAQARKQPAPLQLARGTAIRLPYRDNSFEMVYCVDAIHHFIDHHAFIREAFRVLKPGGALAIIGFDPHEETTNWYIYDYFENTFDNDIRRYPSSGSVLHWLRKEGFKNISSQIAEHIMNVHVGTSVFRDPYLKQTATSQLALLSDDVYQAGIQKMRAAIAEAEEREERISFCSDFFIKMYTGYKPIG
ncbi:MAG: class I SAM-dependent methyltransferase [Anaerolineales bacterium]